MDQTLKQIMQHIMEVELELYNMTILKNTYEAKVEEQEKIIVELKEKLHNAYGS